MIGRRGSPSKILTDNGRNFRGAERELREHVQMLDQDRISDELATKKVEWNFIPPGAPHMGGSWERLVKAVKVALHSTLKERSPREEILQTLFTEAEFIVNSRPLTHVAVDPNDPESLTPNHFLIGSSSGAAEIPGIFIDPNPSPRKMWKQSQLLADHFWRRWVKEYLPSLTRRTKWHGETEPVKTGDMVIIVDEQLKRNSWPRGIIVALHPGRDGVVRVVDVKTNYGIYRRPVSKLCVLKLDNSE